MMRSVTLRSAVSGDAAVIAAVHAASWRSAYRGILTDVFLDGPVEVERLALWRERLATAAPDNVTIVAEAEGVVVGFGCLYIDEDPRWGSFVNNLHMHPDHRGLGVGRQLLREMAAEAARGAPDRPMYLFCLEGNRPARGFYERAGGRIVERLDIDEPDGGRYPSLRYAWSDLAALTAGHG